MKRARIVEIAALAVIAVLVGAGGPALLATLSQHKPWGWLIAAGLVFLAVRMVRTAYDPENPSARVEVTKAGTYLCAAVLTLWAVLLPARWVYGSCIVAAEISLVFDIVTLAAPRGAAGGN